MIGFYFTAALPQIEPLVPRGGRPRPLRVTFRESERGRASDSEDFAVQQSGREQLSSGNKRPVENGRNKAQREKRRGARNALRSSRHRLPREQTPTGWSRDQRKRRGKKKFSQGAPRDSWLRLSSPIFVRRRPKPC